MGYFFLVLTILSESIAIICMKLSDGFHHKLPAAFAILAYLLSFIFLTFALKSLPVGIANAIWAGASAVLVALCGLFIFREHLSILQMVSLLLIVLGLVGLNWSGAAK